MAKKEKKVDELKRFSVEYTSQFYEVSIVYAKDEEEAKEIAQHSDYNLSKWLGTNVVNVREAKDKDIERFKEMDDYFFEGSAKIDENGFLVYTDLNGKTVNLSMPKQKIK